jgi:hypothetical protein
LLSIFKQVKKEEGKGGERDTKKKDTRGKEEKEIYI